MKQIYNWDNLLPDEVLCHPHTLIRIGTSYVFQDPTCNIVRKVSRDTEDYQEAKTHLETVRELAQNGAPILPPSDQDPIQLPSGQVLTTWPKLNTTDLEQSALPTVLRKLHQTPLTNKTNLTPWSPGEKVVRRLEKARLIGVPEGLVQTMETAWEELKEELPAEHSDQTLIHCDAHPENLGELNGTVVLIDLDDIATGPREVDLAPSVATSLKVKTHSYSSKFLEEYAGTYDSELLEKLVRLRHVTMVTWLMTLWKLRPDSQKETIMRITTLHDEEGPEWTLM